MCSLGLVWLQSFSSYETGVEEQKFNTGDSKLVDYHKMEREEGKRTLLDKGENERST